MTPRGGARGALIVALLALAGCATAPEPPAPPAQVATPVPPTQPTPAAAKVSPYAPAKEDLSKRGNYTADAYMRELLYSVIALKLWKIIQYSGPFAPSSRMMFARASAGTGIAGR